jgi:hypothetical protein
MNIKRLLALVLGLSLMLCLCACGNSQSDATEPPVENTTEPITEPVENTTEPVAEPTYTVTVVDQDNAPVAGAWVQLCLEACVPAVTDENGVAQFFLEENDYKVGFTVMPAGYEYAGEEQEWYFADGENTMTVVINKIA